MQFMILDENGDIVCVGLIQQKMNRLLRMDTH